MAWFGQGKDTIEWEEFRDDVLFYKWPANEIKKGSKMESGDINIYTISINS